MKKILHKIRHQPEEVKRHILYVCTIVSGIILVSLWVYSLGTNFSNTDTQNKIGEDLKPFSILKDKVTTPAW